jgi:hypothetical protein
MSTRGGERPRRERHASAGSFRLRVRGEDAVRVATLNDDGSTLAVDVAPFERRPFVRPQARLGREDDERAEDWAELEGERVDLLARERVELLGPRLRVGPASTTGFRAT